jgi:Dynein heavy chain, N-terminal region 2
LIKAPHLKNSTTFTIVNLREYHIQNYREEIVKIIEHANTELKYERVFRAIKDEWDKHELKIIPYKETMDSYILVSTENLSSAIEENLTTLENISQSKYAIHIKSDIEEWISTLKLMLKNLEIWVNAQHHWINLDPILQSSTQLAEVLKNDANGIGYGNNEDIDAETSEFLNLRSQFKRIMWSSFKKPKATYNLMIKTRIEVFQKLIKHFSVL